MPTVKIAASTVVAVIVGFVVGWFIQFSRLVAEHRPDGCDGPCLFLADEFYDDALWGAFVGALVLGIPVFLLARRRFTNTAGQAR